MLVRKLFMALLAGAVLSGCVENTSNMAEKSGPVAVGPGSLNVDLVTAVSMFKKVCVKNAPHFANSPKVLASLPFQQSPSTGTYFHKELNMSFKVRGAKGSKVCSMVFVSKVPATQLAISFGASTSADGNIGVDPDGGASKAKGPSGTTMTFKSQGSAKGRASYFAAFLEQ